MYNVKYVYIYDTTPDVVYVGYTPGYTGCYVYGSTVVYGTGYYYSGWHGTHYYARPATYGFAVRYNPWTGWSVGFGMTFGAPTSWYSFHGYWGPRYYVPPVHYHRPPGGFYGYRNVDIDIDELNINRNYNFNRANRNVYNNRTGVASYSRTTRSASYNERLGVARVSRTTETGAAIATSSGRRAAVKSTQKNNVFVTKKGNVYRTSSAGVQKYERNNWSKSKSSSREFSATVEDRKRGSQRTRNFESYQKKTISGSSSIKRSSGGGRRRR